MFSIALNNTWYLLTGPLTRFLTHLTHHPLSPAWACWFPAGAGKSPGTVRCGLRAGYSN